MKTIDLHGTKHEEAEDRLVEFVVFNEPPFRIVTGNSANESVHNQGSVIVTEKEW
jgi:hypothetical protein